jgi:hypothetical protein
VKRWVPELRDVSAEVIHRPWEMAFPPKTYPAPMVEHARARERALAAFAALKSRRKSMKLIGISGALRRPPPTPGCCAP